MPRVLHVLSQRPSLTGSGITLDSVARHAWRRHLRAALERSLDKPPLGDPETTMPDALEPMTWAAVFDRIGAVCRELLDAH